MIDKPLPFDSVRRELEDQLMMNCMGEAMSVEGENNHTFNLAYHNYGLDGVKHTFSLVCNKVDIAEAQKRGEWSASYPPVEIRWFE